MNIKLLIGIIFSLIILFIFYYIFFLYNNNYYYIDLLAVDPPQKINFIKYIEKFCCAIENLNDNLSKFFFLFF